MRPGSWRRRAWRSQKEVETLQRLRGTGPLPRPEGRGIAGHCRREADKRLSPHRTSDAAADVERGRLSIERITRRADLSALRTFHSILQDVVPG